MGLLIVGIVGVVAGGILLGVVLYEAFRDKHTPPAQMIVMVLCAAAFLCAGAVGIIYYANPISDWVCPHDAAEWSQHIDRSNAITDQGDTAITCPEGHGFFVIEGDLYELTKVTAQEDGDDLR